MNPGTALVIGLLVIALVFALWDNLSLHRTCKRLFREKLEAERDASQARGRLLVLQNTIRSHIS